MSTSITHLLSAIGRVSVAVRGVALSLSLDGMRSEAAGLRRLPSRGRNNTVSNPSERTTNRTLVKLAAKTDKLKDVVYFEDRTFLTTARHLFKVKVT